MSSDVTDAHTPDVIAPPRAALAPGHRLGVYEILSLLGAGAMGQVFLANDARLDRRVAIKVLRPDGPQADLLDEARAMARLAHPNVVSVYEAGAVDDLVYLVMEYIEGQTLRQWLAETPRGWRAVRAVFLQAGRGLAAAHAAAIVHRDFKPDNVLLAGGRVWVSDFGLAGRTGASSAAGTPAYMAPEQHLGDEIDGRADQFAFCVALHEALGGRRPHEGLSAAEVRQNILGGVVTALPTTVPAFLRAVVARGLAVDRAERFPTMDALLARLSFDPGARRRRVALAAALAVTTSLGTYGLVSHPEAPACDGGEARVGAVFDERTRAAVHDAFLATGRPHAADTAARVDRELEAYGRSWSAAHHEACAATEIRHEQSPALLDLRLRCLDRRLGAFGALATLLARGPDDAVLDRAAQATAELPDLRPCAGDLSTARPGPPDPRATAAHPILDRAVAAAMAGVARDALPLARELAALADTVGDDATVAEALHVASTLAALGGDPALAEKHARAALQAAARAGDDARLVALWAHLLVVIGQDQNRSREALALWPAAETALTRAGDPPRLAADAFFALGRVHQEAGHLPEAQAAFEQALARLARDPDPWREARVLMAMAPLVRDDRRLELLHRALLMREKLLGADHPDVKELRARVDR